MTRRFGITDFLDPDECAHLAVAIKLYRRRAGFAVPHSFAELESDLALASRGPTRADTDRREPTFCADQREPTDDELVTDFFTIGQVARRLRVSSRTVERRIADGVLPVVRDGRVVRIRQEDLDEFVAAGGAQ